MTPAPASKVDPAKTHLVKEYKHTSPLVGCRLDPSGKFVFAGAQDNSVVRWHLDSGKKTVLTGHKSWVRALAFAPLTLSSPPRGERGEKKSLSPLGGEGRVRGNKLLFSGDWTGRVLVWPADAEQPAAGRTLEAHRGWVRALAVSPDGKTLASCGNDHLVKLWSIADGKLLRELAGHASHVYNTAFHPDGKHLVSADLMGVVKVWDWAKGETVREFDAKILHKYDPTFRADHGGVRSMAFNRDGSLLACAGITNVSNAFAGVGNPLVVLFDWANGKQKQLLQ